MTFRLGDRVRLKPMHQRDRLPQGGTVTRAEPMAPHGHKIELDNSRRFFLAGYYELEEPAK